MTALARSVNSLTSPDGTTLMRLTIKPHQLWCGGGLAIYIVYEFNWKISTSEYQHQLIELNGDLEKGGNVHPLAQFTLKF